MIPSGIGSIPRVHTQTIVKRKKGGVTPVATDEGSEETQVQPTPSSDSPSTQAQSHGDFARALSRQLMTPTNSEDE
jgi:hypothetical protein